jgi:[ribosomal protein S5]-alanine N-acetyltransferase
MNAPPIVETPRLVLSAPSAADAELIFERYARDAAVTKYLGWPTHRTVADTRAFLAFSAVQWAREGTGPYLIWARGDGRLLGSTGLGLEPGGQAITGYVLAHDAWGQGFATEALGAMVEVAADIGIRRLYALCHPQHRASWHVLEKCGFERDAGWNRPMEFPNLAPGIAQSVLCYRRGLRRDAPRARAGGGSPGRW